VTYGVCLRRQRLLLDGPRDPAGSAHLLTIVFAWMVVVLSLFWTTSEWAKALGTGRASVLSSQLEHEPSVVVYSKERLDIEGPGVLESNRSDAGSTYHYRYTGLRFLLRNGDEYILLPILWPSQDRVVVVLPRSASIRLQFKGDAQ
jgi:hypothetical protein